MVAAPPHWLDEVDLDPTTPSISMGTRSLRDRPWLVVDDDHDVELTLKRRLLTERHDEVFATLADTEDAGRLVVALVEGEGITVDAPADLHPLDRAGRAVQEDLCLLRRRADGWHLEAASLCFPSRWRLTDKLGQHITRIHEPVEGYGPDLAARVDGFLDRLPDRPAWRRNWFIHPDPDLFQPDRPEAGDPVIPAADVGTGLYLRSERQTLRRLESEWVLFTIRVQQRPLADLLAEPARAGAFRRYLQEAPPAELSHRGMGPAQVEELCRRLDQRHEGEAP